MNEASVISKVTANPSTSVRHLARVHLMTQTTMGRLIMEDSTLKLLATRKVQILTPRTVKEASGDRQDHFLKL